MKIYDRQTKQTTEIETTELDIAELNRSTKEYHSLCKWLQIDSKHYYGIILNKIRYQVSL